MIFTYLESVASRRLKMLLARAYLEQMDVSSEDFGWCRLCGRIVDEHTLDFQGWFTEDGMYKCSLLEQVGACPSCVSLVMNKESENKSFCADILLGNIV